MCGRAYHTYTEDELAIRALNRKPFKVPKTPPNYNLSPTQESPVVLAEGGKRSIELLRWGLVPFWAKDIKIGYKMINARADTIAEKPSFRAAYKKRRCLVPLTGFVEWRREGETKRPFCIYGKEESILMLAGIWEEWTPEGGKPLRTFSIITTDANSFMEKIHDRMPVIFSRDDETEWLDPDADPAKLHKLLKPCPSAWLKCHEVSTAINSPKNNRAEVIAPLH